MKQGGIAIALAAMAVTACVSTAPEFMVAGLAPTAEESGVMLTGWLKLGDGFRLYPSQDKLGSDEKGACISGVFLSLAGPVPPEYDGKRVTLTGRILRAGEEGASSLPDACGAGLDFQVSELTLP